MPPSEATPSENAIPVLPPEVYAARRQRLMERLGPGGIALFSSRPERARNSTSLYRFRQASDVLYFTGFDEPGTTVILRPGANPASPPSAAAAEPAASTGRGAGAPPPPTADGRFVMFVRPRDPATEVWDGRRAGLEGAVAHYGAEVAHSSSELRERLAALICNCDELHYAVGIDPQLDALIMETIAGLRGTERRNQRPPRAIVDPMATVHELRLHKEPEELALLRRAAAITAEAHIAAMRAGRPGTGEHELEALVDYTFRRRGGNGPGYNTIVGAGANATILHYIENRAVIRDGDLVLIDAGCELGNYTADITRTFPANGRFSAAQRELYDLVLEVQRTAIDLVKPGATINEIHHHCVRALTDGLIRLGLLTGSREERIADGAYRKFFMHGTSHWLGMDVHDVGAYTASGSPRPLAPGMVITVEPGLYCPDDPEVPERFRSMGVRIEDDILVTTEGHENLTLACPKTVEDVELTCGQ